MRRGTAQQQTSDTCVHIRSQTGGVQGPGGSHRLIIPNVTHLKHVQVLNSLICFPGARCLSFFCSWVLIELVFLLCLDAQRALELLQQYRVKLGQRQQDQNRTKEGPGEEDHQLQQSLDRVISVFQSQLFSALLGKNMSISSASHCLSLFTISS